MNLRYLVDTDWAIDYLHGDFNIVERLTEFEPAGLGLSLICLAELYEGIYYSSDPPERERGLHRFLGKVKLVVLIRKLARCSGTSEDASVR